MKDLKSPLRYPGGKSRATNFLFDSCNMPVDTISAYREPFLGGGSCAFAFTKMHPKIIKFTALPYQIHVLKLIHFRVG